MATATQDNKELEAALAKAAPELARMLGDNSTGLIQAILQVSEFGRKAVIDFIKKSPLPPEVKAELLKIIGDVQVIQKVAPPAAQDSDYIVGGLVGLVIGLAIGTALS